MKDVQPAPGGLRVDPKYAIALWILLGYSMVMFNKIVLSSWGFAFPFFLTTWHCVFSTIVTQVLARWTPLMGSLKEGKITQTLLFTKVAPMSACFALGLVLGNSAYLHLSIAYIQMLKSLTPVLVLLIYFAIGREKPSLVQLVLVLIISFGVSLSSLGEHSFTLIGFLLQTGAMCCDVMRMNFLDSLLLDVKLDTLSTLYYLAPFSACFIFLGFIVIEAPHFPFERFDPAFTFILIINAAVAFSLNLAVILLVSNSSALTMSLAGLLKDVCIVASSVVVFGAPLTAGQVLGYGISMCGLGLYREFKKDPTDFIQRARVFVKNLLCCLRIGGRDGRALELIGEDAMGDGAAFAEGDDAALLGRKNSAEIEI